MLHSDYEVCCEVQYLRVLTFLHPCPLNDLFLEKSEQMAEKAEQLEGW